MMNIFADIFKFFKKGGAFNEKINQNSSISFGSSYFYNVCPSSFCGRGIKFRLFQHSYNYNRLTFFKLDSNNWNCWNNRRRFLRSQNDKKSRWKIISVILILTVILGGALFAPPSYVYADGGQASLGWNNIIFMISGTTYYNYYKTTSYVSCPPGNYTITMGTGSLTRTKPYFIIPLTVAYRYNGICDHCLSFMGQGFWVYEIQSDGTINYFNGGPSGYVVSPGISNIYFEPANINYYNFGIKNNDSNSYNMTFKINRIPNSNNFFITPYFEGVDVINPSNFYKFGSLVVKLYNSSGSLLSTTNKKIFEPFTWSLSNGTYKIVVEKNQNILSISVPNYTALCGEPSYITYYIKNNTDLIITFDVTDGAVNNINNVSPTELNKIPNMPTGQNPSFNLPSSPTFPEFPSEEPEEGSGYLGKFAKWIKDTLLSLFVCDNLSIQNMINMFDSLMQKFPFRVLKDIQYILNSIGSSCPVFYIHGPGSSNPTGSWSPCQTIPSNIIQIIKTLFNIVIILTFIFSIYRLSIYFFARGGD